MEPLTVVALIGLAFFCEFIDSTLGMGYGTIITPALLILGFEPSDVIPAVLVSQAFACLAASGFHRYNGNLSMGEDGMSTKYVVLLVGVAAVAVLIAVIVTIDIPDVARYLIIACVVIAMGLSVMARRSFKQSTSLLHALGLVSVFIKAITGAGFGPMYTTGQILSGRKPRRAIALSTFLRVPICLFAFMGYTVLHGGGDLWLPVVLSIGALAATPIGPSQTSKLTSDSGRMAVGVLSFFLGVYILMWLFIRPYLESIIENPFFWAMLSMFALMGCTASLMTKRLGKYLGLNAGCVGIFALGRFLIPIACCDQPQFHGGPILAVIGFIVFVVGLVFLCAAFSINPWPAPDEQYPLVTSGFYALVRHPMYLGEVIWTLGWSIMFGSILGVALVPIWWGGLLFHAIIEEEHMEQMFGQRYIDYVARVRGRLLPGLPL